MTQSTNNFSNARDASRARRKALSQSGKSAISPARSGASQKQVASPAPAVAASLQAGLHRAANGAGVSGKAASIARRKAMSSRGKAGVVSSDRTREDVEKLSSSRVVSSDTSGSGATCGCGCNGEKQECKTQIADSSTNMTGKSASINAAINGASMMKNIRRQASKVSAGRAASYARREAMSKRGKAGISSKGLTTAQTARAANPGLSSRELAMTLRDQRSRKGRCGEKKSEPCGRVRPNKNKNNAAAQDAPWKVGASETTHGQILTGTMVGRSLQVTGDEPSTCRDVTGTDYFGADMFRDFCQSEPRKAVRKVDVTSTVHGNAVSGNKIGRGENVTGNEAGSCKSVTGNEYLSSNESEIFCGTKTLAGPRKVSVVETGNNNTLTGSNVGRSEKVTGDEPGSGRLLTGSQYTQPVDSGTSPVKVGLSQTLRGGNVSGTLLDRTERVTGNEAGTCRNVTGDEYLGQEQFKAFCKNIPEPADNKVEVSATDQGNSVTGVMTSRSKLVTGNEPGTCKAVTGTPYAGADQASAYCGADEIKKIDARTPIARTYAGSDISGIQPAIGGDMTGDSKGACEPVSGTPYVGADQLTQVCPSQPADINSADFPQPLASAGAIENVSGLQVPPPLQTTSDAVTGSSYGKGRITGPFGMADGKVTGTEQARFGDSKIASGTAAPVMPVAEPTMEGRIKSRISGEGMDAGTKITGNDWGRGEHVTGTEGTSAIQRNPTFHGVNARAASSVSVMKVAKRNDDVPVPVSKVTGSSGNTIDGSLVTYSGGARG